jgi:hypothetical protein
LDSHSFRKVPDVPDDSEDEPDVDHYKDLEYFPVSGSLDGVFLGSVFWRKLWFWFWFWRIASRASRLQEPSKPDTRDAK